jgi:hypothetical protein
MGRKAGTISAHSHGLERKNKSGCSRGTSFDFLFYRTYQDQPGFFKAESPLSRQKLGAETASPAKAMTALKTH